MYFFIPKCFPAGTKTSAQAQPPKNRPCLRFCLQTLKSFLLIQVTISSMAPKPHSKSDAHNPIPTNRSALSFCSSRSLSLFLHFARGLPPHLKVNGILEAAVPTLKDYLNRLLI